MLVLFNGAKRMISSVDGHFKHSVHFARRLPYAAHSVMSLRLCALYSTFTVDACVFSPILLLLASFTESNQGIHSIDLLVSFLFLMKALPTSYSTSTVCGV